MHDLRSALRFIILTIIARLLAYFIVRFIESLKPRNVHFIIAPSIEPARESLDDPNRWVPSTGMTESVEETQGTKRVLPVGTWIKLVRVNFVYYVVVLTAQVRNRFRKTKAKLSLKLVSEIIGLITAIVSLLLVILSYFLK